MSFQILGVALRRAGLVSALALASVLCVPALAAESGAAGSSEREAAATTWPQWGGPQRSGAAEAPGLFSPEGFRLEERWRRPISEGLAGLVSEGDRLFTMATFGGEHFALALEAHTGQELWRQSLGSFPPQLEYGPASTPAVAGSRVFFLSPACQLTARSTADGKALWHHDLNEEYSVPLMQRGCWTSPLLDRYRLVVQINGQPEQLVMAFDQASGKEVWRARGTGEWAVRTSPTLAELSGVRQVVVHDISSEGKGGLYALRAENGELLWNLRFPEGESFSYDTPLVLADQRIAQATWNSLRVVEVRHGEAGFTAAEVWKDSKIKVQWPPFNQHIVHHQGYLYGFGGDELFCLEAANAELRWREKVYPGSLILVDGHLVVLSQAAGLLRVVRATPQGYEERARVELFEPGAPTDTPPSVVGRWLFLRNSEEMVALEVVAEKATESAPESAPELAPEPSKAPESAKAPEPSIESVEASSTAEDPEGGKP
jgi:outer membrane protein assembly factor BamB